MCKSPPGSAFCIQELQAEAKESALIDLDFEWQGFRFRDSFTWSLANRNLEVMKAFALHTLEDLLGKDLDSRQAEDIDAFCTKVACEISKQAAAAEYLNCTPVIVGPKNTEGQIEEHIIRIHLDYGDSLVRIKDEFDWDLSSHLDEYLVELINRVDVFAESYVVEQELPYAYKPVISKLIKQQIQRKQCELFVRMRESIAKSSLLDKDSSKSSSRPLDPVPDTVTDWNPQNFLFNGSLEDVLGPMGQFKYASMEDVKDNVPGYLKAKPRARILEHLKEAAHNAAEEKASDKTATEAMNELESNKSECSEGRASGLVIVVNKETMEVEVVGKDGKIENNLKLSLIHICRCRRYAVCRSRWSPYH
eukprot:TRINITY_DN6021_c0_g1_i1.p1 TRINITY_DN6021_c0_g1~~TRINITY_DN6021_c0_g1_i1.p1  ORF type:complete len:363 (-),score=92.32 TRINITY_DN6021_c0_g1_i1:22-1110(-)